MPVPGQDDQMVDWSGYTAWLNLLPPNRPGQENLAYLRSAVASQAPLKRCVILGSTPEYRTLLRKLAKEVVIVDKSVSFKIFSDGICGTAENEVFIEGDWLKVLGSSIENADLIASHFTHGNVPFASRVDFFVRISNALRPDGIFFDTVFQPCSRLFTLDEVVDRFKDAPSNLRTYNDLNAVGIFQGEPIREFGRIDTSGMYEWINLSECDEILRLARWTERLVTPRKLLWDYHPDFPPEYFGYWRCFKECVSIAEHISSPFAFSSRTVISRRR